MLEIIHSPRLEDLADHLAEQLCAQRRYQPENILQPIVVVVGHLGIARWLERRIATRFGIFANVRFLLTAEWLNAEMARFGVLEKHDAARFSVNAMTWVLYALLVEPERFGLGVDKPFLERERFQLAAKLARLFSEYLIYRREWLLDFEQQAARASQRFVPPGTRLPIKEWQARLWCAMSARLEGGHRAAKFQALLNVINSNALNNQANEAPIYIFGLNHLPPDVLTLLERFSESTLVQIYFPNPCVEYWADVVRERFLAQRRLSGDLLQPDVYGLGGFDHFDVGHPLLASLGGHGQAYFAELSHATADFTEVRAVQNQDQGPPTPSLLTALQYGITHLQPDFAPPNVRFDSSIQVFGAQNVVDELNQVKAILFAALLGDPNLQLEEIVIMTPSLSRYAPLLPAVFGAELCASPPIAPIQTRAQTSVRAGARAQSALRYSVLDLTEVNVSPLLHQLLQSPELRWEPAQLLALLALDELAPHFNLDANDLTLAPGVLERAHIAFGFNDAHRRQLLATAAAAGTDTLASLPSASLHTWEAGLERLLFGYLHGNQAPYEHALFDQTASDEAPLEQATSPERLWSVPDINVGHAPILSALLQLIRALRVFNFGAQRRRTVPEWTRWLERQIFSFTGAAATDALRALFTQLELDATQGKAHEEVSFVALREACHAAMAQASGRSTPALGAICVCGLVPMRALPFKVVCILGLNEAEFPKPELPDSLNLMRANGARRPGDRSRVQEDRYLFLEAIMAARSQLVLSYQGLSSDGSARQPCSVLNEFLAQMEQQFKARVGGTPWFSTHGLAPAVSPAFSASLSPITHVQPIMTAPQESPEPIKAPTKAVLSVNVLLRFWQQPLRTYVQQRLRLSAQQTEGKQALNADNLEPLGLAMPPIQRIEARLLTHALEAGIFPKTAPFWLGRSGLLASGALGLQSYANLEQDCRAAWEAINSKFPEFIGAVKQPVRIELNLGKTRLSGYIPDVYVSQRACVCVSNKALHGLQRWQLLLRILLLRASEADSLSGNDFGHGHNSNAPWRALHLGPKAAELVIYASPSEARTYLQHLIALRSEYLLDSTTPPWFWPKLSYTAFSAKSDAYAAVLKVIEAGNAYELASSGLKFWLPNAEFFESDSVEFAQFLTLAQTLFAPFAPSKQAQKPDNRAPDNRAPDNRAPDNPIDEPPPRTFTVTPLILPKPNLPPQSQSNPQPNTLDLEHFGHDDAADFENGY